MSPSESSSESAPLIRSGSRQQQTNTIGSKYQLRFIEPSLVLLSIHFSLGNPVTGQFVYRMVANSHNYSQPDYGDNNYCRNDSNSSDSLQDAIQAEASKRMVFFNLVLMMPAFPVVITLGSYSDKAGRKIALILPAIGFLLRSLVLAVVSKLQLPIDVLFLAFAVEGLTGGLACSIMASISYVCDTTSTVQRSMRIMVAQACLGVGLLLSELASGYLIDYLGFFYTFIILVAVNTINLIYLIVFVKETVQKEEDVSILDIQHFLEPFVLYFKKDGTKRRLSLCLGLLLTFLSCSVLLGYFDSITLYLLNEPFCWSARMLGYFGAFQQFLPGVVSVLITKFFQGFVGDGGLILLGCISGAGSMVVMALATSTLTIYMVPVAGFGMSLIVGMIRSLTSKIVRPNEQGIVLSGIAWTELIGALSGSLTFDAIYAVTVTSYPGAVFFMMAGIFIVTAWIALLLILVERRRQKAVLPPNNNSGSVIHDVL